MMARTYFAILGVSADASQDEIRSAFRRLAKEFHPDHSGGDSGSFRQIQEAYSVLGDARRRREYERSLARTEPRPTPARPVRTRRGAPVRDLHGHSPLEDLFDWLWHGAGGLGRPRHRRVRDYTLEVALTREQALRGGRAKVRVPVRTVCPSCGGFGGIGFYACRQCDGEGMVLGEMPFWVPFPPGLKGEYAVDLPLDRLGIHHSRVTVLFRTADEDDA